jgi:hypothetical protein
LCNTVEKADIIDHYGTPTMPMQLGMMAEFVYGRGVMGQDGTSVRRMLMMRGGDPNEHPNAARYQSVLSLNV